MITPLLPKLNVLPATLPIEGAIRIELEEGVPIFRAADREVGRHPPKDEVDHCSRFTIGSQVFLPCLAL